MQSLLPLTLPKKVSTFILALHLFCCTLFVLKMQRNCPSIRLEVSDDGQNIFVTLCQESGSGERMEIVMDSRQFSSTLYALKAIELKMMAENNNTNNNEAYNVYDGTAANISEEKRPNTPTPPANFAELFANVEQCSNTVSQDESGKEDGLVVMDGVICDGDENNNQLEQPFVDDKEHNFDGAVEYDPVNFQIDRDVEDEVNSKYFDQKLYELYHPETIKKEVLTPVESDNEVFPEKASASPPQESSRSANKTGTKKAKSGEQDVFLDKYAKLISKKFWEVVENRCSDAKNNRNFVLMKLKDKLSCVFDELHAAITESEFGEEVCDSFGKDYFTSNGKRKIKLINIILKYANKL